jgi:DNA-binding MarR family transcriptional regulator
MVSQEPAGDVTAFIAAGPDAVLGYTVVRLAHALERRIEAAMGEALNLTVRQFGALAHLARDPGLGSGALGRLLLITPQSAGALVDGLERRGLLARDRSAGRGRTARVTLTDEGEVVLGKAYRVAAAIETQLALALPSGQAAMLNGQLQAILAEVTR